jgi:hypothetical protein
MGTTILRDPAAPTISEEALDATVEALFLAAMPVISTLMTRALRHQKKGRAWGFIVAARAVIDMSGASPELVEELSRLPPDTPYADLQPLEELVAAAEMAATSSSAPQEIRVGLREGILSPLPLGHIRTVIVHPHGVFVTSATGMPAQTEGKPLLH